MRRHTEIYFEYFGYDVSSFVPCECCGNKAVDVHHIEARGMGGDPKKKKEVIENLMALCRKHHEEYGDKKQHVEFLRDVHIKFMNNFGLHHVYVNIMVIFGAWQREKPGGTTPGP